MFCGDFVSYVLAFSVSNSVELYLPQQGLDCNRRPVSYRNLMKRIFDISLAILLLSPAILIILLAAVLVLVVERNNPFYAQIRLGRHEKPFRIYKIRTMYPSTQRVATHHVPAHAITRSGHVLRRLKIDEIPQLFNVIFGHLSLVGPRPSLPQQIELVEARRKLRIFDVAPGITGLGQVMGVDMSEPQRLAAIDAEYIRTQSMRMDIQILIKTFTYSMLKSSK